MKTAVFRHRWQAWKIVRSIAAVRQRPRTPRNWRCSFAFFESFPWHFNKKQRAEVIFRLSRPVSCENQENGSGKQWSLHAPLKTDYKQASPDFFVALEFEVTLFNISCFSGFFHFCLTGCPQGWTSVHGGSCYQAETRNFMNFSVAAKSCKTTSGAYLVEIQSQSENEFVAGLSIQDFWIGYRAQAKDLPWIWSNSGVVGSYTNWNTGQPNFFPQTQPFCAIIWKGRQPGSKTWDDSWCGNGRFFVCETGT